VRLVPGARGLTRAELDITDETAVREVVRSADLIYNCAAYNAVDRAESEPEVAQAINAEAPGMIAALCREAGARLVHFSTNYVFDGSGDRAWRESDSPRPLGAYARSKLEGETRVLAELPSALVVRGAGLFGRAGVGSAVKDGSFPERIVARARSGEPVRVVADQRLNPTYTPHLAAAAAAAVADGLAGVVHLAAAGCCSWWEFAVEALRAAGVDAPVEAVTTAEFPAAAARPLNGCLESERRPPLPDWRQGLAEWALSLS